MSLGLLARDSMVDLAGLVKDTEENNKSSTLPSPAEGTSTEVLIDDLVDESADGSDKDNNSSSHSNNNNNKGDKSGGGGEVGIMPNAVANPQQAQEEDKKDSMAPPLQKQQPSKATASSSRGQPYAGFHANYPEYQTMYKQNHTYQHHDLAHQNYQFHSTYAPFLGEKGQKGGGGFLCCLFPWVNNNHARIGQDPNKNNNNNNNNNHDAQSYEARVDDVSGTGSRDREDDEQSNASDVLGEKLSVRERQAVLARLGLAQPDGALSGASSKETDPEKKGLLKGLASFETSPQEEECDSKQPKGILKNKTSSSANVRGMPQGSGTSAKDDGGAGLRRSLFPTYEKPVAKPKNNNHVSFAPMARVSTVKSQHDMTPEEKGDIWWQKSDYDDFRKTGRIITQAMLQGGSEIWLASNESWQHGPNASKTATLQKALSLADRALKKTDSADAPDTISTPGDKWWHRFGHSRRGLEHVVSIEEGRERQANVKSAIRAVLDEQTRQKLYRREDPEKLRMVSINHTSWARDLALAAGASDADAVSSSFAEDRKSREFYLLKMARTNNNNNKAPNSEKRVPGFMQPAMRPVSRISQIEPHRLDAHTAAQIRYRRHQQQGGASSSSSSSQQQEPTYEHIHDPNPEEKRTNSLAQRAAGFSHIGEEKVNMSAVLSGLGGMAS